MIRNTVAALAIAAVATTALIGASGTAEAGGKKRFFKHHTPHFKVWHGHKRFYRGKCHWLKKKALYTDSRYWWKRYYKCRAFYY